MQPTVYSDNAGDIGDLPQIPDADIGVGPSIEGAGIYNRERKRERRRAEHLSFGFYPNSGFRSNIFHGA